MKPRKLTSIRIAESTIPRLKQVAEDLGLTQSAVIQSALNEYLDRHERPTQTGNAKTGYQAANEPDGAETAS